jgi:hypothetical protein
MDEVYFLMHRNGFPFGIFFDLYQNEPSMDISSNTKNVFYNIFPEPQSFAETFALKITFSAYCICKKEELPLLRILKFYRK